MPRRKRLIKSRPLCSLRANSRGMDSFFIRREVPEDIPAIFEVNCLAFGHDDEARLVDALRVNGDFNPDLSLVAVFNDRIIGHILFPEITIESDEAVIPALALAPLVVHPDFQGRGIGTGLVEEGLGACRFLGNRIVIVVGHPGFYPRFGFSPACAVGIEAPFVVADDVFMALALVPGALDGIHGRVHYPKSFESVVGADICPVKKVLPLP
jgi:putative acetyltransferase